MWLTFFNVKRECRVHLVSEQWIRCIIYTFTLIIFFMDNALVLDLLSLNEFVILLSCLVTNLLMAYLFHSNVLSSMGGCDSVLPFPFWSSCSSRDAVHTLDSCKIKCKNQVLTKIRSRFLEETHAPGRSFTYYVKIVRRPLWGEIHWGSGIPTPYHIGKPILPREQYLWLIVEIEVWNLFLYKFEIIFLASNI